MGTKGPDQSVTCIACGTEVPRGEAREYDKYGDRWDRADKTFEYLCKRCYSDVDNQPRKDLEVVLEQSGAGRVSDAQFLERFFAMDGEDDVENEHDG
ncbi:MAG: hypothetical protein ABEJ58_07280 [Halodesulfurarchaeum sp.]